MIMPIAPGRALINSGTMPELVGELPKVLQNWDLIQVNVECRENYLTNLTSVNIYANVLPIGPNKIIIFNETDKPDIAFTKTLYKHRIDYIHVRLRHSRLFGGGAHCATLDLIRDEGLEDYFS
jgi:glycine amidinotransferase